MAVAIKLDEATLAKVKEYAAETFEGFDADRTSIIEIKRRSVNILWPWYQMTIVTEPHTLKDGTVLQMGYERAATPVINDWFSVLAVRVVE